MSTILGVKFRDAGQIYYFSSGAFVVNQGDAVIVNTDQGYGLGYVVIICDELPQDAEIEELKPIYRIAADDDVEKQKENEELAQEAFEYCRKRIRERKLEMKLVEVDVFFDRSKIIFYFTAPNRIDFRELVKDLVRTYRTRIELRQIGVRHETQMVGAVGNCGQVCCCRRFLRKFAPVTIRMAKEQNLFLNPAKISGMCGRLLCCLSYEQSNYEEFHRSCPKIGKKYTTRDGVLKVLRANLFRNSLSVVMDGGEEREYTLEEWAELAPKRPDQTQQGGQQGSQQKEQQADQRESQKRKGKPAKQQDSSAASSRPEKSEQGGGAPQKQRSEAEAPRNTATEAAASEPETSAAPDSGGIFGLGPDKGPNPSQGASAKGGGDETAGQPAATEKDGTPRDRSGDRNSRSKRKRSSRSRRSGRSKGQSGNADNRGDSRNDNRNAKGDGRGDQKADSPNAGGKKPSREGGDKKPQRPKPPRPQKQEGGAKPEGEAKSKPRRKRRRKPKPKPNQQ